KGKILEVDCKTALFLRDTTGIGDTELRVGTDLSFTPLTKAKNRTENATFVNADTTNLPFKSNTFDYVFCMGLSPEVVDLDSFIKEIIRVLKPTGRARILAFAEVLGFEAFFSPTLLRNIAEKYGYRATIERERYGGVDYHFITLYPYEDF
ncbi:MAG: class I SAM-dependent methyltransferase, partial [Candidatus Woesearchaeota archaeon]